MDKADKPKTNNHNLSRDIPEDVKRQVRQNCGFGCAICGKAFYHNDHFSPEYAVADKHNPDGIVLLCAEHHDKKTRGTISAAAVSAAAADPKSLQAGFSFDSLEISSEQVVVQIGSTLFLNPTNIIRINGAPILSIKKPVEEHKPFLLTLITGNSDYNKIVDNEWQGASDNWDVKTEGNEIIFWEKENKSSLHLINEPSEKFIIKDINIEYDGYKIQTLNIRQKKFKSITVDKETVLIIKNPSGVEIARIGSSSQNLNTISWENALDVNGDFMNADMINTVMHNTNLTLQRAPESPINIIGNTFTGTHLNLGVDKMVNENGNLYSKIVEYFNHVGSLDKFDMDIVRDFKESWAVLQHTSLISQLPPGIIEDVK